MLELPARLVGRFVTRRYDSVARRKLRTYLGASRGGGGSGGVSEDRDDTPPSRRKGVRTRLRLTGEKLKDTTSRECIPLQRIVDLQHFNDTSNHT